MKYLFLLLLIANVYGQTDTVFVTDTIRVVDTVTVVIQGTITIIDTVVIDLIYVTPPSMELCLGLYALDWTDLELCDMVGLPRDTVTISDCPEVIEPECPEVLQPDCPSFKREPSCMVTNLIDKNIDNGSTPIIKYDVKGRKSF